MRELHELHLVELVLPDQAADVAAVRAGLGPEAGRAGAVAERQAVLAQDLVAVQVGDRHLGGRYQEEVAPLDAEEVVGELRQLAGAGERGGVDEVGGDELGVAVAPGVEVEHVGDQGALEHRPAALENREAARGHGHGALEVDDVELRPEVPVGLGLEVEGRRLAPAPLDPVGALVGALGNARMNQVRDRQLEGAELLLELAGAVLELLGPAAERRHLRLEGFGLGLPALPEQGADRLRARVAPRLQLLDLDQSRAPGGVDLEQAIERRLRAARLEHAADALGVAAEQFAGEHDCLR